MNRYISLLIIIFCATLSMAQTDSTNTYQNTANRMMQTDRKLTIGGYAQIDYNQPLNSGTYNNGLLDVHRLVLLFGYKFNSRTQFITELEIEHVKEVFVEQAFLDYRINNYMNLRAGLMLIPMGIVNEYHEPPTFMGVERPLLDKYIVPTTWREIGIGITGNLPSANLKYQAYIVNGFSSYTDGPTLRGSDGLRKGRQKGAKSFMSSPNFTTKIEYYGFSGLNIGLSGYIGNTQSTLYNGLEKDNTDAIAQADSSVVGISMIGLDARYSQKGLQIRGQLNYANISNTDAYNNISNDADKTNDLGSALFGYYLEAGYNVFQGAGNIKTELIPFIRYSEFDTHHNVEGELEKNDNYHRTVITTGLGWKVAPGAIFKIDMQFLKTKADNTFSTIFNAGVGIWF
ncbi:MAG: hypothetical protein KAI29_09430 [Cyclobacteriaceae bacterium]|nr:hypothetical protein [Cyclobacteriaceae bacterium]